MPTDKEQIASNRMAIEDLQRQIEALEKSFKKPKIIEPKKFEDIPSDAMRRILITPTHNLDVVRKKDIDDIGGGKYAVGYDSRNSATGTQAITGVGFEPKLIIIKAVYAATPGSWSIGHATSTTDEYCIYVTLTGIVSYDTSDIIMATGTGNNEAVINSIDSDGFTLNWTASNDFVYFMYECFG